MNFPPVDVLKDASTKMMIALNGIVEHAKSTELTTSAMLGAANAYMVGIIWCGTFAGRSGEWVKDLLAEDVIDQLRVQGKEFLTFLHYKTAKLYGELGKWLSPGVKAAMLKYLELPISQEHQTPNFFKPVKGRNVAIPTCLKRISMKFFPSWQAPKIGFRSKTWETLENRNTRDIKNTGNAGSIAFCSYMHFGSHCGCCLRPRSS
jgi:hypothetical protein